MSEQESFSKLTVTIKTDPNLTIFEKVVLAEIISFSSSKGYCWTHNRNIAEKLLISISTVSRAITKLKKKGYIEVETVHTGKTTNEWERHIKVKEISMEKPTNSKDKLEATKKGGLGCEAGGVKLTAHSIIDNLIDKKKENIAIDTSVSITKSSLIENFVSSSKNSNFFDKKEGINSTENILPENKIISNWNLFKNLTKHEKRNTNTYKKINKYLTDILSGEFKNYSFDKDWKVDNKIKLSKLNNITETEINAAIYDHNDKFEENYKPMNKKYLAKSFDSFLYNPMTKKSQFLFLLNNPIEKIDEASPRIYRKHLITAIADQVDKILDYKREKISKRKRTEVYMVVGYTCKELQKVVDVINLQKDISNFIYLNSLEKLGLLWLQYVDKYDNLKEIAFSTKGYMLTNFLEEVEIQYKISVDTSEANIKYLTNRTTDKKVILYADHVENDIYGLGE